MFAIRRLNPADADRCDAIMRSLPDFFGHEGGLASCAEAVRSQRGAVAEVEGSVLGFATWERRTDETAEITWAAVQRDHRHSGAGTAIVEAVCAEMRSDGFRLALAMTSASSKDSSQDTYVPTRAFWKARGFHPLIELDIWDTNFALLMVRPL
jgi:N-acetylglutamate synthase-like GNAT family acetyltransferase